MHILFIYNTVVYTVKAYNTKHIMAETVERYFSQCHGNLHIICNQLIIQKAFHKEVIKKYFLTVKILKIPNVHFVGNFVLRVLLR